MFLVWILKHKSKKIEIKFIYWIIKFYVSVGVLIAQLC